MVLGNIRDVFLRINVMSRNEKKLDRLRRKVANIGVTGDKRFTSLQNRMHEMGTATKEVDSQTGRLQKTFSGFRMEMLSTMFAGMQLMAVFGGIVRSMLKFTGVSTALGSAIKVVMLPVIQALTPALLKLADFLLNLPKPVRMLVGALVVLAAIFGAILFIASQFVLVLSAVSVGAAGLVAAAGALAAGLAILVTGFVGGIEMVKQFGEVVTGAIMIVGALLGVILGLPLAIPAAIVAVIGAFIVMRDEIGSVINSAIGFLADFLAAIGKMVVDAVSWFASLPGKILDAASDILSVGKSLGKKFIRGLTNGIKALASGLKNAFFNVLPGPLAAAVKGVSRFAGDLVGGLTDVISVNDALITSGGKVIEFHQDDNIMAFQDSPPVSGGGNITINFDKPQIDSEIDIDSLIERVKEDVEREMTGRGLR